MDGAAWAEFFGKVPAEKQDSLLLGMDSGSEVSLQRILKIDERSLIVRGRIGGTTDMGRVFCIPLARIAFAMFTTEIKDAELSELFDGLTCAAPAPVSEPAAAPAPPSGPKPEKAAETAEKPEKVSTDTRSGIPAISLRERLRARQAGATGVTVSAAPRPNTG